ncbi:DNA recombination protein RmuC [Qipengyuania atrilutea]|uniref:DNA recombination protein RmuC homolog n=1 Tax=Qipengyuania atrilutea TaxID=2744473 RepID=A0A850H4Z4_9SPHN|nr:DNA recombination protein RmuC [Actirhodobacter atriluteus]NVD45710.1 DNA recombination protein RmuC [Actirhodobacter atriluteus]
MDTGIAILAIVALLIGGLIGWFAGSRPVADWKNRFAERDGEARELDAKFLKTFAELEAAKERALRADSLAAELRDTRSAHETTVERLRGEHARVANDLAELKSGAEAREKALEDRYAEREKHFERELARLVEAEEKLQAKFNEIGEKMLDGARTRFLEGAQSHLTTLNRESLAELEKKVGPVGETLERYRKRVEELEKNRAGEFERLYGVIGQVREGQERVMEGANRITTTLRGATKARGDWGELQLANLLESCGLYDKADFNFQVSVRGDDSNILRPDAVINIPGGRRLVVDVKNVFNTYARANEAESEEERHELLRSHVRELRTHIDELSAKRYQDFVEGSADFVVMFVPGEHVLYAALTQDGGLLDYALKKQIVLSSPLNFMSIALTVSTVWRQAGVQADAQEIAALGKELYDRLAVVAGHMGALRKSLASTNSHFDKLVGSFDTNLRRTGERFEELSIDTSAKDLAEALPIGHQPRRLANFAEDGDGAEEREAAE